jgi:bacterioferritin
MARRRRTAAQSSGEDSEMGTRGREIVGMDVEELIRELNRAYASEWLAYYQYWLGAKLIKGPMKDAVAAELTLHATEELSHADLVAARIIQLGGTPVTQPGEWFGLSPCKYDAPDDPYVAVLLDQNIVGEQCAISVYKRLMDLTKDKDMVTYNLALRILEQEVEHEEDLQSLKEDLVLMTERGSR